MYLPKFMAFSRDQRVSGAHERGPPVLPTFLLRALPPTSAPSRRVSPFRWTGDNCEIPVTGLPEPDSNLPRTLVSGYVTPGGWVCYGLKLPGG